MDDKLTAEEIAALRRALETDGEDVVRAKTGLSRNAVQRAAAGLKVQLGTVVCIRLGLHPQELPA